MGRIRGRITLEEYCKKNNMNYLLDEWDYEKNKISPSEISYGSHTIVSWKCSKGHRYKKDVHSRCQGVGCSQCSGVIFTRQEKIFDAYPEYLNELDEEFNDYDELKGLTCGSAKKVHWKCSKGHKYIKSINNKIKGEECPICSNKIVLKGYNDLETWCKSNNKEDILNDWDYKNNSIKPDEIVCGSNSRVHFICHICGHRWTTKLYARTKQNTDCPICKRRSKTSFPEQAIYFYMKKYFEDSISGDRKVLDGKELDIYIPSKKIGIEYDGDPWHKDRKLDFIKEKLCKEKNIKLIRIRESNSNYSSCDDIYVYKYQNWSELDTIIKLILEKMNITNPVVNIEKDEYIIKEQFYSIIKNNSLAEMYPEIAKEWHPTKNGKITPEQISSETHDSYYWICPKCGAEYKAMVKNRVRVGSGCKVCGQITTAKKQMIKVINLDTGEVFENSTKAAKKYNISKSGIIACCRGITKTSNGYKWSYLNREESSRKKHQKQKTQKRVLNIDTGEIYDSLCDAVEKTKIVNIEAVCNGRRPKAGGYHWKYIDDKEQ